MINIPKTKRTRNFIEKLIEILESSVRVTHLFLSNLEIENIKPYVAQALQEIPYLVIIKNDNNNIVAFLGIKPANSKCCF